MITLHYFRRMSRGGGAVEWTCPAKRRRSSTSGEARAGWRSATATPKNSGHSSGPAIDATLPKQLGHSPFIRKTSSHRSYRYWYPARFSQGTAAYLLLPARRCGGTPPCCSACEQSHAVSRTCTSQRLGGAGGEVALPLCPSASQSHGCIVQRTDGSISKALG